MSFGGQKNGSATGAFVSSRSEPISLATLDRDCFIIPVRSLERFLPAGVPVSSERFECCKMKINFLSRHFKLPVAAPETKDPICNKASTLSVLEVSDPKVCILAHLMSPLEPLDPLLESPLSHPLIKQRAVASELLNEVIFQLIRNRIFEYNFIFEVQQSGASGGMLLANMERHGNALDISLTINATSASLPSRIPVHRLLHN